MRMAGRSRPRRLGFVRSAGVGFLGVVLVAGVLVASEVPASADSLLVSVTVAPAVASVPKGETKQFEATGHYLDGSTANLTSEVTWSSSSTAVVTVSNASGSQGLLTANGTGVATITATDTAALLSGTAAVTVLPAVLLAVTVSPATANVAKGETQQLTATGLYSDGTTKNLTTSATWTSSSASTASVSSTGLVTGQAAGLATITSADPSSLLAGTAVMTVGAAALVGLTVQPGTANVAKGATVQLTATGTYSDGTTKDLTKSVTWSSSNGSTATVSSAGLVTGQGGGSVTVTATDPSSSTSGGAVVTVGPAVLASLTVSPSTAALALGETEHYTATGTYSDGTTKDLTKSVTWSSSGGSTATVSPSGVVTANSTGSAAITATDPSSQISGSAELTVGTAVLVAVTVSPSNASVPKGATQQLTATGLYSDGSTKDLTGSLTWSSSSGETASVASSGLVTALGTGSATVTATDPASQISGTADITVVPAILLAVTVSPTAANLPVGDTQQLTATGLFSDGATSDLTSAVTWSSSGNKTATVSSTGLVTGKGTGAATIMAVDSGALLPGTAVITVLPAVVDSLTLSMSNAELPKGETEQLMTTGLFSDGTTSVLTNLVTWSSSDPSEVSVSSSGVVTALGTGAATITAIDPVSLLSGTSVLTVVPAVLDSLSLSASSLSLPKGETQQLTATGLFSDGTTSDLTDSVDWASSSSSTASVSPSGLVTALATGPSTVQATDPLSLISGSSVVNVVGAVLDALTLSLPTANLSKGRTQQLTATGTYTDGTTADLTRSVTWTSSVSSIASVSSTGLVTALQTGVATIAATDPLSLISGTSVVTVLPAVLDSLSLSESSLSLPKGESQQLTATGVFSDGTILDLTNSVNWLSSSSSTASVSPSGLVTALVDGTSTITATDPVSLISDSSVVTVLPAVLDSLDLSSSTVSLPKGESEQLTATGVFSDGTTSDVTNLVDWATSNGSSASVSSSGLVQALTTGTSTITATDPSSLISVISTVTVLPAVLDSLTLSSSAVSLPKGESQQLTATGLFSDGTTSNLTNLVNWVTSSSSTASVSPSGLVTALVDGTSTITATDPVSLISDSSVVTVLPAVLDSLDLSSSTVSLAKGESEQLTATGLFSDGTTSDLTNLVNWVTSNGSSASVSSSGLVQALTTGTSTITATDPSSLISAVSSVTVLPAVLDSLSLSSSTVSLAKGETQQLAATGLFSDGTTSDLTSLVSWSSSDTSTALVSPSGLVTALGTGVVSITATDLLSLISGTSVVTVLPAVLDSLSLSSSTVSLAKGETEQLTATGLFSDGTTSDLTSLVSWSSSNSSTASVSPSGLVTALGTGVVSVTATDLVSLISAVSSVTVLPAVLDSLTLSSSTVNLPKGETEQLTATGLFSDGTTSDLTSLVGWSSSDTSTASVSSSGLVTALTAGVVSVTATDLQSLISGTSLITVVPAVLDSLTLSASTLSLPAGETQQLTAIGVFSDGTTSDLTSLVEWATSSSTTASVSPSGLVTALTTGVVSVTATDLLSLISAVSSITVLPAVLVGVAVSPLVANVPKGDTLQLTATGLYSDGATKDLTGTVTWSSSGDSTVTVSSSGLVTAQGIGAGAITATDPSALISGAALITVLPAVLVAVTASPLVANVPKGGTQQLTATGLYSDGTSKDLTGTVNWSSSDPSIASVSTSGLLSGVAVGQAVVSAVAPSLSVPGITTVNVTAPSITISPASGRPKAAATVSGQGFTPGTKVKVIYKTGVASKPKVKLCAATVGSLGTFTCSVKMPTRIESGAKGAHTVYAKEPKNKAILATTTFTLS